MSKQLAIREKIAKYFICERHMQAIESTAKKHNFAVSFREAGEHTIAALTLGAAAKGHNILEKTIKESSIRNVYRDSGQVNDILAKVRAAKIMGYVGHWGRDINNNEGLIGIYITYTNQLSPDLVTHCPRQKFSIYKIDMENLDKSLDPLKRKNLFLQNLAFSGDYDMHDMIILNGAGRPRTALMYEEEKIINVMNEAIANVDIDENGNQLRPFASIYEGSCPRISKFSTRRKESNNTDYNVIRHGPQVNFTSYMMEYERDKVKRDGGYLAAVANPGAFPLAMIDRENWSIIENIGQLKAVYDQLGAVMKNAWQPDGLRIYKPTFSNPSIVNIGRSM